MTLAMATSVNHALSTQTRVLAELHWEGGEYSLLLPFHRCPRISVGAPLVLLVQAAGRGGGEYEIVEVYGDKEPLQ